MKKIISIIFAILAFAISVNAQGYYPPADTTAIVEAGIGSVVNAITIILAVFSAGLLGGLVCFYKELRYISFWDQIKNEIALFVFLSAVVFSMVVVLLIIT